MKLQYKIDGQVHDIYYIDNKYNQISKDLDNLNSDKIIILFDSNISKEIRNKVTTSLKFLAAKFMSLNLLVQKNKSLKAVLKLLIL